MFLFRYVQAKAQPPLTEYSSANYSLPSSILLLSISRLRTEYKRMPFPQIAKFIKVSAWIVKMVKTVKTVKL
jgi:hypothetical protein